MTVADVFNAITEHRPYRRGMQKNEIIDVFETLKEKGEVCTNLVDILLDNLDLFIDLCHATQRKAAEEYESFISDEDESILNAI